MPLCFIIVKRFSESLSITDKALKLFEGQREDLFTEPLYEALIANRALCNYELKNLSESLNGFELLSKKFPENNSYKEWLAHIKVSRMSRMRVVFYILLISGTLMAFVMYKGVIPRTYIDLVLVTFGFLGLIYINLRTRKLQSHR